MARRYDVPGEALDKYEEFHRYPPKKIGAFHARFKIPERAYEAGKATWVTYRSAKVDPATLRKPRKPVDYIHEFSAGVKCYLTDPHALIGKRSGHHHTSLQRVEALVRLGACLGYEFELDGEKREAAARAPFPDLYCTDDGKVLLVIQSHREVIAMFWGGALGVFARGIDG